MLRETLQTMVSMETDVGGHFVEFRGVEEGMREAY